MGIFKRLQNEVEERKKREGITLADLLELSPPQRRLMNRVTRYGELTAEQAAEMLNETPETVAEMLNTLAEEGYLLREKREGVWFYQVHLARKRGTALPPGIWSVLGSKQADLADESDEGA